MERMPSELLIKIFKIANHSWLDQQDITAINEHEVKSAHGPKGLSLAQVCRRWRALLLPSLYQCVSIAKSQQFQALADFLSLQSRGSELVHRSDTHDAAAQQVFIFDPRYIRTIVCAIGYRGSIGVSNGIELCRILSYTTKLECMIARIFLDTPWLEFLQLSCAQSLTQLSIGTHGSCLTSDLIENLNQLFNLQKLHFDISSEYTASFFRINPPKNSQDDTRFTLPSDASHFPRLSLPKLTCLKLAAADMVDSHGNDIRPPLLRIVSDAILPFLTALDLTVDTDTFDETDIDGVDFRDIIRPFASTLTHLKIQALDYAFLSEFAELAPNLLYLSPPISFSGTKLCHPLLRELSVHWSTMERPFVDDINLETLPHLEAIHLTNMCWSSLAADKRVPHSSKGPCLRGAARLAQRGIPLLDTRGLAFGNLPQTRDRVI